MPAGTYHCVLDGIVITPVDVTFDLVWRQKKLTFEKTLGSWTQHFDPTPGSFDAQAYEHDVDAIAIDFADGDELVFRYTGSTNSTANAWIPNGDGATANGRIPNITLPK